MRAEFRNRVLELLETLDVAHRAKAMPSQLTGEELQIPFDTVRKIGFQIIH